MPELLEAIKKRRSIRRYKPERISKDIIIELLDFSRYAANAHNAQPFRFIIILNQKIKSALIKAMGSRFEADLRRDGLPQSEIQKTIERSNKRFLNAPVLILACLTMEKAPVITA